MCARKKNTLDYCLSWEGKENSILEAKSTIDAELMPFPSLSREFKSTQNKYIIGDNLDALKILKKEYTSKINMIYIDPPYNTGNSFVYNDNRSPVSWLNMMYPRLILSRDLLSEDGLIFISISSKCMAQLQIICDEVFGKENCLGNVSVIIHPAGKGKTPRISETHEFLLIYCKTKGQHRPIRINRTKENIEKIFNLTDEKGKYYLENLMYMNKKDTRFLRPNQFYPVFVDNEGMLSLEKTEGFEPVYPIFNDGLEGTWAYSLSNLRENLHKFFAIKINNKWKIKRKVYLYDENGENLQMVKSIWDDPNFYTTKGKKELLNIFNTNEAIFDYPKPLDFIKHILTIGTKKDSIVLDFFSGSSTTAHAVMQKNSEDEGTRKFIMVQQNEPTPENSVAKRKGFETIHDIALKRLELISNTLNTQDNGVKVFKILHNS